VQPTPAAGLLLLLWLEDGNSNSCLQAAAVLLLLGLLDPGWYCWMVFTDKGSSCTWQLPASSAHSSA
jgi:hypothetical protein